jgi:putative two-component system response regulator
MKHNVAERHNLATVIRLVITQALCLAVGLLMHERFLEVVQQNPAAGHGADAGHVTPSNAVHLLSFLWIGGLQAAAAWLVLTRIHGEQNRSRIQAREELYRRDRDLMRTRNAVIFGLSKLAESRDPDTGFHLERIALYSTRLAKALRLRPDFAARVSSSFVQAIGLSSALHDIGKVGIEDGILLKPGPLTPQERERIQHHTIIGEECIRQIQSRIGDPEFLEMARQIAAAHHERWDGSGYPNGVAENDIPLAAQIVAIADVYDALSVRRVYKEAYSHEDCVAMIRNGAGTQFNPHLVDVFLSIQDEFREIADRFRAIEDRRNKFGQDSDTAGRRNYVELRMTEQQQSIIEQTVEAMGAVPAREPDSELEAVIGPTETAAPPPTPGPGTGARV